MKRSDNMEQILAYIDAHPDKNITVGELAALLDYSFYHFCHAFSSYTGVPVAAYLPRGTCCPGNHPSAWRLPGAFKRCPALQKRFGSIMGCRHLNIRRSWLMNGSA